MRAREGEENPNAGARSDGKATRTGAHVLSQEERVDELARMLGGVEITAKTREHAAEMLAGAPQKRA